MKRLARALFVMVSLGVIGSVVSLVPQGPAAGADGAPVNIISSVPLSVQQSGTWSVGLAPNTSVGISGKVPVANPLDANSNPVPLLARNAEDPGRIPFHSSLMLHGGACTGGVCTFSFGPVTSGKRLVVQHVSIELTFDNPATLQPTANLFVGSDTNPATAFAIGNVGAASVADDRAVQVYVDQGQSIIVNAFTGSQGAPGPIDGEFASITGYLLDCSAAPCAPIASF